MRYRTRDGDVLDAICWTYYGRVDVVPAVLEANRDLARLGPVLPAGVLVELPALTALPVSDSVSDTAAVHLWD